jgi:hypothetical protein
MYVDTCSVCDEYIPPEKNIPFHAIACLHGTRLLDALPSLARPQAARVGQSGLLQHGSYYQAKRNPLTNSDSEATIRPGERIEGRDRLHHP